MKYRITQNAFILCLLLSFATVTTVFAQKAQSSQNTTVDARVVNEQGQPLSDIQVSTRNSGEETLTDENGRFSIRVQPDDQLIVNKRGYKSKVVSVGNSLEDIVLQANKVPLGDDKVELPFHTFKQNRTTSAVTSVSGDELIGYSSANLMEALAGKLPGVVVQQGSSMPGQESAFVSVRGQGASIYIDGVERNASDLSADEVEEILVFKDLSSRAALGLSGSGPVIWITTKQGGGKDYKMDVSVESGVNTPTVLPQYLNSYDYARLYNEARVNDGDSPIYSDQDLENYKNAPSDPFLRAQYPNVDYYNRYVNDYSSYRAVNLNFSGINDGVSYFGLIDYKGSTGLESVGEQITSDRFKLRGNVSFPINDWIDMRVRVAGSYKQQRYPNVGGGGDIYNMFSNVLSRYPSNAHAISYNDSLLVNNDYPENLTNELLYSGYGESVTLNSHNDAELLVDLNEYVKGLTFNAMASFNIYSSIAIGKGGTEALYRIAGQDLQLVQEYEVDPNTNLGGDFQTTSSVGLAQLKYDRVFDKHAITMDGVLYRSVQEGGEYQPEKQLDLSYRANYAYDQRYVAQLDVSYSGSMRLPEGERFNLYPTAGLAWIASNESFLKQNGVIDYLKLYASAGKMGINSFNIFGYNPYYLNRTTWQTAGSWFSGVVGSTNPSPITIIQQSGNPDIKLPEKTYFNAGIQSRVLDNRLSVTVNYFREKNTGLISPKANFTSALVGDSFLPAVNFGANKRWGVDGAIQFSNTAGDLRYSIGGNAMYSRGKHLIVDEPQALADYRKLAGTAFDMLWGYQSEGLYQSDQEIQSRGVNQSWGALQPGDIRYQDYNEDGVVDQKDIHPTGAHSPRVHYGLNFSVGYKGLNLFVQGSGVADGTVELNNDRYFKVTGSQQNYSELMLDRWTPEQPDSDYPRLTVSSQNNVQSSTFWHRNAAYFRINNAQLSYTLPADITQKTPMSEWKLFVRGKNLFVFSDLKKYNVDPANINAGIYSYPLYRTITAGIAVKL